MVAFALSNAWNIVCNLKDGIERILKFQDPRGNAKENLL
jgi:hypothetical protein